MRSFEITSLNGTPPFYIYVCDASFIICDLIDVLDPLVTPLPVTYFVPDTYDRDTPVFVKIIDSDECETFELFDCSDVPLPSLTPTITPTITPTNTITPTITPTNTPTNTVTPTNTPTNTVTPSITKTPTKTPTNTPTNTVTPSITKTPTQTPRPTRTPTRTPAPTSTPTGTPCVFDVTSTVQYVSPTPTVTQTSTVCYFDVTATIQVVSPTPTSSICVFDVTSTILATTPTPTSSLCLFDVTVDISYVTPTPSVGTTNVICTEPTSVSENKGGSWILNGITLTHNWSGSVQTVTLQSQGILYCAAQNIYMFPGTIALLGVFSAFEYWIDFSSPVNDVTVLYGGAGDVPDPNSENFIFTTDTGIPTITEIYSCLTTINGNEIITGANSDWSNNLTGSGKVIITNSTNFTRLTIQGNGGKGGTLFKFCFNSPQPTLTPTHTQTPTNTQTPTVTPTITLTPTTTGVLSTICLDNCAIIYKTGSVRPNGSSTDLMFYYYDPLTNTSTLLPIPANILPTQSSYKISMTNTKIWLTSLNPPSPPSPGNMIISEYNITLCPFTISLNKTFNYLTSSLSYGAGVFQDVNGPGLVVVGNNSTTPTLLYLLRPNTASNNGTIPGTSLWDYRTPFFGLSNPFGSSNNPCNTNLGNSMFLNDFLITNFFSFNKLISCAECVSSGVSTKYIIQYDYNTGGAEHMVDITTFVGTSQLGGISYSNGYFYVLCSDGTVVSVEAFTPTNITNSNSVPVQNPISNITTDMANVWSCNIEIIKTSVLPVPPAVPTQTPTESITPTPTITETVTQTPTITPTILCECTYFDIIIEQILVDGTTGNTLDPSLNGKIFVSYARCPIGEDLIVETLVYISGDTYSNAFCSNTTISESYPVMFHYVNNVYQTVSPNGSYISNTDVCCISVTPTPTQTPTTTVTPTDLPITPTPTITETVTQTPTESITPTPTITETSIPDVTPSNTPTETVTPTNTPTNTITPTITPTNTNTPTVTPTQTPAASPLPPSPADTSLAAWYDASTNVDMQPTGPSSGATITQWNDKAAGQHNLASGALPDRPQWFSNVQNSLGVLYFNGVDLQSATQFNMIANVSGITAFVVSKFISTTSPQIVMTNEFKDVLLSISGATSKYTIGMSGGIGVDSGSTVDTNFHVHTIKYNGSLTGNENRLKYRRDKNEIVLDFQSTSVGSLTNANGDILYTGSLNDSENFNGYIGEIIIYSKILSDIEIVQTENYLSNKWAL